MGTISATFTVADTIEPALNDPMQVIEDVLDNLVGLAAEGLIELVEAEWIDND